MIQTGRKAPKPTKVTKLEEQVAEQQKTIEKQAQDIENLTGVIDDLILNSMGGAL